MHACATTQLIPTWLTMDAHGYSISTYLCSSASSPRLVSANLVSHAALYSWLTLWRCLDGRDALLSAAYAFRYVCTCSKHAAPTGTCPTQEVHKASQRQGQKRYSLLPVLHSPSRPQHMHPAAAHCLSYLGWTLWCLCCACYALHSTMALRFAQCYQTGWAPP